MEVNVNRAFVIATAVVIALSGAHPPKLFAAREAQKAQSVALPYTLKDDSGATWDLSADGSVNDGGDDLYDGGAHLFLDGNVQFNPTSNQVPFDPARNELTFGPQDFKGMKVSRRVSVDSKASFIRYAEVFENPTGAAIKMQVRVYFETGGSVQSAAPFAEEKRARQQIGCTIEEDNNNCFAIIGAGRSSKIAPHFNPQQNTKNVDLSYEFEVPAKQTVVLVHIEARRGSVSECQTFMQQTKDKDYLKDLPRDLSRHVINFAIGVRLAGDLELLRPELNDLIEMRGDRGDKISGTIKEKSYRLSTFFGMVEIPAERVIAMQNVGEFHPRQLLVTKEGEILGGELEKKEISIELSNGIQTSVPVEQISRMGFRRKKDEPDEWTFEKPLVLLRSGERLIVGSPEGTIEVLTRYGLLKLTAVDMHALALQSDESPVHQILLSDGSKISGLASASSFDIKLSASGQSVKVPAAAISRLQFSANPADIDDTTGIMTLSNDDQLIGSLTGNIKLRTGFGNVSLSGPEVRRLTRSKGGLLDVQIEMWDQTTLSGELEDGELLMKLTCGVEIKTPVNLLDEYNQPRPQPSLAVAEAIVKLAVELGADDWNQREEAQKKLIGMGPVVINVLKGLREKQSPEGQQRIDQSIAAIEKAERPEPPPPQQAPNEINDAVNLPPDVEKL